MNYQQFVMAIERHSKDKDWNICPDRDRDDDTIHYMAWTTEFKKEITFSNVAIDRPWRAEKKLGEITARIKSNNLAAVMDFLNNYQEKPKVNLSLCQQKNYLKTLNPWRVLGAFLVSASVYFFIETLSVPNYAPMATDSNSEVTLVEGK